MVGDIGSTNFIEFSSVKDRSARDGFSGDRTKTVFNSSVWRYGKFIAWGVSELLSQLKRNR